MSSLKWLTEKVSRVKKFFIQLPTVAVLLPIQGISVFIWWIAGSYFGVDVYTSRIFPGDDTWCQPLTQGLGNHCWGDYYYTLVFINLDNPFLGETPNPYPAAALTLFMVFELLTTLTGIANFGVFAYITFMAATISYSVWFATKSQSFEKRITMFSTLVLLSPAVLAALDRGNSVGFLVPAAIWLFSSIRSGNTQQTLLSLALLSVIKPHFGLVGLAFMVSGRVALGIKSLCLGAAVNVFAFLIFWPRDFPSNVFTWVQVLFRYQDYHSVATLWPQNVSFAQSVYSFTYSMNLISGGIFASTLEFLEKIQGLIGPAFLTFVFLGIYVFRKTLTMTQVCILALSSITMTSAISYYYYVVIAIPFLLSIENTKPHSLELNTKKSKAGHSDGDGINLVLWLASLLSLVQIPIPWITFSASQIPIPWMSSWEVVVASGVFVGGIWILCYFVIFIILVRHFIIRKRLSSSAKSGHKKQVKMV